MDIHLVGVLHNDPEGYDRTQRALVALEPSVLALEWAGPEYEAFRSSSDVLDAQAAVDTAIRGVFVELGLNPDLYDEGNKLSERLWYGEVRAARAFAEEKQIPLVPTEDAQARIEMDRRHLGNVESAVIWYRRWLCDLLENGEGYDPVRIITPDLWEYDAFANHLGGEMSVDFAQQWLADGYIPGALNATRLEFQMSRLRPVIQGLGTGRLVHIGGLAHLVDDGLSQTDRGLINLWQTLKMEHLGQVHRHGLMTF